MVSSESSKPDAAGRYAPQGWNRAEAERIAREEGLEAGAEHWDVVEALQEYFAKHEEIEVNMRELHDALEEKFHAQGGMKYLYRLLPGGPVAQGCRLAGLPLPAGAVDESFGSVQ
jgi:tRNA 2-thiouridine synthesizing protein E